MTKEVLIRELEDKLIALMKEPDTRFRRIQQAVYLHEIDLLEKAEDDYFGGFEF